MIEATSFERVAADEYPERDRREHVAHQIERVVRIGYTRIFEKNGILEAGTIRRHLADEDSPKRVKSRQSRIRTHVDHNRSAYHLAWDNDELLGLAKVSPLEPAVLVPPDAARYINDVISVYEGYGVGSRVLYESLKEYPGPAHLYLDKYNIQSRANQWFDYLGFRPADAQPVPNRFSIGEVASIDQTRLRAPNVEVVRKKLFAKIIS